MEVIVKKSAPCPPPSKTYHLTLNQDEMERIAGMSWRFEIGPDNNRLWWQIDRMVGHGFSEKASDNQRHAMVAR